jgi:hypothetical protein
MEGLARAAVPEMLKFIEGEVCWLRGLLQREEQ